MWSQLFQRGLKVKETTPPPEEQTTAENQDAVELAKRKVLEAKMKLLQGKMDVARAKSYAQTARYRAIQAKKSIAKRQAKQPALVSPKPASSNPKSPSVLAKPTIDIFNAKRKQAWMVAEELMKKHPKTVSPAATVIPFSFGQLHNNQEAAPMASPFATVSAMM